MAPLKFLLIPLSGGAIALCSRTLLAGSAERYPGDVVRRIAGQLAQQLER